MGVHTGVYVVYCLYRSRYAFVADHWLRPDQRHAVDLSDIRHALKFSTERQARQFIADDLERPDSGPYFVSELSPGELMEHCPDLYEMRRAAIEAAAA